MKFLLLNQTFYPDVVATGQYLTELALRLAERGHEVTVVTSRRLYDTPERQFPNSELWRGIRIIRIWSTGFGKKAKWRRLVDFCSFLAFCSFRLTLLQRHDAVVALSSPPLIAFLGACIAKLRKSRFFHWVMDLNPDEALAAGWLREGSWSARFLEWASRFSFRHAHRVIALDRFVRDRILAKGFPADKVVVLPLWSNDDHVNFDPVAREFFRKTHGLDGKFVVMYCGHHSPCHPLDTLLEAADHFRDDPQITFCFIGGGSEWRRIKAGVGFSEGARRNLLLLPYRPLSELSASLSAADLHVIVMGEPYVGILHPCKVYNLLKIGLPIMYIGPRPSHITEILETLNGPQIAFAAAPGKVDSVVSQIRTLSRDSAARDCPVPHDISCNFSKETLIPKLIQVLESL